MNKMYDWNNYDNDMAYSYDDYLGEEEQENIDAYEDYLVQQKMDEEAEKFMASEYESKMAEQLIDSIYDKM